MVIVIMGAAGAGKTTVGRALAEVLGWAFCDADALHAPASILKMRNGVPLTEEDRGPWLERVRAMMADFVADGRSAVVACSALRAAYRAILRQIPGEVRFVHLDATPELLRDRVGRRSDHFAPVELISSQLATLEPPDDAVVLDASQPVELLVAAIRAALSV